MIILDWHSKYFRYKATQKALKRVFEEREGEEKEFEDILVVLICVEKGDDINVAEDCCAAIKSHLKQIGLNKVLLYPYAHLSNNLAMPSVAFQIMKEVEEKLKENGVEVYRAPFGYYKEFECKVYGHPLAELSKRL